MSDGSDSDQADMEEILDYVAICLYDVYDIDPFEENSAEDIIHILIRNSLTVQSSSRLIQYFEDHLHEKSKIHEFEHVENVRNWCLYVNHLQKHHPDYTDIQPFKRSEYRDDDAIVDVNYVKHRLLAYEVSKKLNGNMKMILLENISEGFVHFVIS